MREDEPPSAEFQPTRVPDERPGPAGGKRHANRLAKTRALCEAGLATCLERGLVATTVEDIALAAGVSKGSFYRYFDNKADMIATLFAPLARALSEAFESCVSALERSTSDADLQAAYGALAARLLVLLQTEPDVIRLFLQERHGAPSPERAPLLALDDELLELAIRTTRAGQASGMLKPVDPRVSATMVLGGVHELLWRVFHGQGPDDPSAGAMQLIDIVLHGVRLG